MGDGLLELYKNTVVIVKNIIITIQKCDYNSIKMRLCGGPIGTKLIFHPPRLRTRYPHIKKKHPDRKVWAFLCVFNLLALGLCS